MTGDGAHGAEWLPATVVDVRPGATYEGVVYDQDLVVRTDGEAITLFDMAPRVAEQVLPGEDVDLLVAVAVPGGLRRGNGDGAETATVQGRFAPPAGTAAHLRDELRSRQWCLLRTRWGPALMAASEIEAALGEEPRAGELLSWETARLDVMGWRRAHPRAD